MLPQVGLDLIADMPGQVHDWLRTIGAGEQLFVGDDRDPRPRHIVADLHRTRSLVDGHDRSFVEFEQLQEDRSAPGKCLAAKRTAPTDERVDGRAATLAPPS